MAIDTSSIDTRTASSAVSGAVDKINGGSKLASADEQSDRFLKLLVTQMQNQDPLNPMDNAQITTQMAQISTVSGIDNLNKTIASMNSMLLQSQSLEAASLIGKSVMVPGSRLTLDANGRTSGGFDLGGAADTVVVRIKDASGLVIDSVNMGAQPAGRLSFDWQAANPNQTGLTFEVSASANGVAVDTATLNEDIVRAVYQDGGLLTVELDRGGVVRYSDVKAIS